MTILYHEVSDSPSVDFPFFLSFARVMSKEIIVWLERRIKSNVNCASRKRGAEHRQNLPVVSCVNEGMHRALVNVVFISHRNYSAFRYESAFLELSDMCII